MNRKKELLLKINGSQTTEILYAASAIGLIESLRTPQNYRALPGSRLIGALRILKLVQVEGERAWLTEEGKQLLSDHPETLLPLLKFKGAPFIRKAWSFLAEGLQQERSPFELAHGMPLFEYLRKNREALEIFHDAMRFFARESSQSILEGIDFSPYQTVVDVGGSLGAFSEVLKRHAPHLKITLFDRPEVIALAEPLEGITSQSGDFFRGLPPADLYIFRNILHDWSDASATKILKTACQTGKELLIIETCRAETPAESLGHISDLSLFVTTGEGLERTEREWLSLFTPLPLTLLKLHKTGAAKSLFLLKVEQDRLKE